MSSQSISISQEVGLLKVGRNVTLNSVGTLSDGTASFSLTEGLILPKSSPTQITSITTGVAATERSGVITTVPSTLAADASAAFTVTNAKVTAESVVLVSISGYAGAADGSPIVRAAVSAGSFVVTVTNAGTEALDDPIKIAYLIV
jgi:hypothetical protein